MVIRDRNGRPVPDDLAKLPAKQQPGCRVLIMVVALITRKKQNVGINGLDVLNDILSPAPDLIRISRERGNNNLTFIDGITPDQSLVNRTTSVGHTVWEVFLMIPAFHTKRGQPADFIHIRRGDHAPRVVIPDLQLHLP